MLMQNERAMRAPWNLERELWGRIMDMVAGNINQMTVVDRPCGGNADDMGETCG